MYGRPKPATTTLSLHSTSTPLHSHIVASRVLSCFLPSVSATVSTTLYFPAGISWARVRMMPVSVGKGRRDQIRLLDEMVMSAIFSKINHNSEKVDRLVGFTLSKKR